MLAETATPLRRPTRRPPSLRSRLDDSNCSVVVRVNVLNNTNHSGGMYSHANHIWMNGIFLIFWGLFFHNIGIPTLELALERRSLGKIGTGYVDTHWAGGIIGETRAQSYRVSTNGVKSFWEEKTSDVSHPVNHVDG